MKHGFTLIELLAVIVILAIIALIAVPIVIGIINDAKKSSEKESIKLYLDHAQKIIAKEQIKNATFNPSECDIKPKGILECKKDDVMYDPIEVEMNGKKPESGIIKIENNKLEGINLKLNGLFYQVKNGEVSDGTKKQVSAGGTICTGGGQSTAIGTKYSCEVKPGKSFDFYVLSKDGDNINLIMNRNICSSYPDEYYPNGEPAKGYYIDEETDTGYDNRCWIQWNDTGYGVYGPTGVMMALYVATKDWSNVPTIELNYTDEANSGVEDNGYTSLVINNGVATITGKKDEYLDDIPVTTIGTIDEPLKARIPKVSEVMSPETGCNSDSASCEPWLVDYLADLYVDRYESNTKLGDLYGYWLLSSAEGYNKASVVDADGFIDHHSINPDDDYTGIRPVITVPISALGN